MPHIMHLLRISAAPERVFQAITTADGVRNWWTRETTLDRETGEFAFYERRVVTRVRVDELTPPIRVGWTTMASTAPGGWEGTTITFDLRA